MQCKCTSEETLDMKNPPSLSTLALPIGTTKSGDRASSDTSNDVPYMISFSKTTTETQRHRLEVKQNA